MAAEAAEFRLKEAASLLTKASAGALTQNIIRDYTQVVAPVDGVVTDRKQDLGILAKPETELMRVAQIDPIRIQASVALSDVQEIKIGTPVKIWTDKHKLGKPIEAKVTSIFKQAELPTRTVVVEALVPNKQGRILPGDFVTVDFQQSEKPNVLVVANKAIIDKDQQRAVWIVDNGKASLRYVTTGTTDGVRTEIIKGLSQGDIVITRGQTYLHEGDQIANTVFTEDGITELPKPPSTNRLEKANNYTRRTGFNISAWCMERPYWVVAFYASIIVLCLLAINFYMPRRMMPYVVSPMLGVVTMMPGLSAEEMETYLSKPIEERMVAINGVRFIRSTSQDGFSIVSLEFPYGTDMKKALVDVQALMNVVQGDLPVTGANLKPSWVVLIDPLNIPVLTLSITGDKRWDPVSLRQLADNTIINRLKTVPNVYSVSSYGGRKRQLQIVIDRTKLSAYGLSILDVKKVVDDLNVARPAGVLTSGPTEAIVRLNNLPAKPEQVEDYPVKAMPGGRIIYLKDIASVRDTHQERRSAYHYVANGKIQETVAVNVVQTPGASSPKVIAGVLELIKQLEKDNPGIKIETAYDNAHFVEILFENMWDELALAVLLTGLSIFLFLDNWRTGVVAVITLPITLLLAILCMVPLGLSLNSSTLIGLVLGTGRDTDDTVVDLHCIEKHMRMGKDPKTAAVDGVTEIRLAVLASTLMTNIALIPLLVCGGIVEQMFVGLVWPIILGNTCSFFVELTLTPLLASKIIRLPDPNKKRPPIYTHFIDPMQRFLARLEQKYGDVVAWTLANRFTVTSLAVASIIVGMGFYNFIGSEINGSRAGISWS
jgi:preprotein translocase subunit SecF